MAALGRRLLAATTVAGAAALLRRAAACEEAPPPAPKLSGEKLLWCTEQFKVLHDPQGKRVVRTPSGEPFDGPLPAGVEVAYQPDCKWESNWDGLAHTKPRAKRMLHFVRHGQYDLGSKERELHILTKLGHMQAEATAKRLQHMRAVGRLPIDRLVHSDMIRAVQTADAITQRLPGVPVECMPDLAEGRPCIPQPSHSARKWSGPRMEADGARIDRGFHQIVHRACESAEQDEHVVVVCHANVIRYFVCRALQLPPEAWLRMSLPHCSLTTLCVHPGGRVSMHGFGDAGHLDPTQLSK
jgi:serine/threonine-protein phosphatase PGAM5